MSNTNYNKNVLDHFQNPRNMGELENADAEATVGNPNCGDAHFARWQVAGGRWQVNIVLCRARLVQLNQVGYIYGQY